MRGLGFLCHLLCTRSLAQLPLAMGSFYPAGRAPGTSPGQAGYLSRMAGTCPLPC